MRNFVHLALAYPMILAFALGCTRGSDVARTPEKDSPDAKEETSAATAQSPRGTSEVKTYKDKDGLNTLIAPFEPPTLEELEKNVEWVEQPVVDTMERLQEHWQKQPTPIEVEAALKIRNDSAENNKKILGALGRLPASAEDVDWEAAITHHWRGDARTTNPIFYNTVEDGDISVLLHSTPFTFDWEFRFFADKAVVESWHSR
jgi:hypothetical protein